MGLFHVVTPLRDQLRLLEDILRHWTKQPAAAAMQPSALRSDAPFQSGGLETTALPLGTVPDQAYLLCPRAYSHIACSVRG